MVHNHGKPKVEHRLSITHHAIHLSYRKKKHNKYNKSLTAVQPKFFNTWSKIPERLPTAPTTFFRTSRCNLIVHHQRETHPPWYHKSLKNSKTGRQKYPQKSKTRVLSTPEIKTQRLITQITLHRKWPVMYKWSWRYWPFCTKFIERTVSQNIQNRKQSQ